MKDLYYTIYYILYTILDYILNGHGRCTCRWQECVADAKADSMSVELAFRLHCDGKTPELVVSSRSIQMAPWMNC